VRAGEHSTDLPLPPDFNPAVFHLLRIEGGLQALRIELDSQLVNTGALPLAGLGQLSLFAAGVPAQFAGFALSRTPDSG
jgi:hypothetical protein